MIKNSLLLIFIILTIIILGCGQIDNHEEKTESNLILEEWAAQKSEEFKKCAEIKAKEYRDYCYYESILVRWGGIENCNKIEDIAMRHSCQAKTAIGGGNFELCKNIQNKDYEDICKKINSIPNPPYMSIMSIKLDDNLKKKVIVHLKFGVNPSPYLMSPNRKWIMFMTDEYEEGKMPKISYYIVNTDGSNLKQIEPEFYSNSEHGYPEDLFWSLDNIAYFRVKGKTFAYNPKNNEKVESSRHDGLKYYNPTGKPIEQKDVVVRDNLFKREEYILSPKEDWVVYKSYPNIDAQITSNEFIKTSLSRIGIGYWILTVAESDFSNERFLAKIPLDKKLWGWSQDGQYIIVSDLSLMDNLRTNYPPSTGWDIFTVDGKPYPVIVDYN